MRFKVGDMVVLVVARTPKGRGNLGREAVVERIGKFPAYHRFEDGVHTRFEADYRIRYNDGEVGCVLESQLVPKRPPQTELGSWGEIARVTGWSPTKEVA